MDKLEKVKQHLEAHQRKGNAISAGEFEQPLGYPTEDTHAKERKLVMHCANNIAFLFLGTLPVTLLCKSIRT